MNPAALDSRFWRRTLERAAHSALDRVGGRGAYPITPITRCLPGLAGPGIYRVSRHSPLNNCAEERAEERFTPLIHRARLCVASALRFGLVLVYCDRGYWLCGSLGVQERFLVF